MQAGRASTQVRPLIVLEGPPGCSDADAERVRSGGATLVRGLQAGAGRDATTVCVGVVTDEAGAAAALLAALDGVGLVLEARATRQVIDRLVDDLRRLGPVDHRRVSAAGQDPGPQPPPEAREILALLAEGCSLGEAAAVLGLSRRTADRRLAAARAALGVERTTEAVSQARRLGWLPPPSG